MGVFGGKNMAAQRSAGGGLYFKPGVYVCKLNAMKVIDPERSGKAFVAEFLVLESNNEDIPVGAKPNYFVKMSGDNFDKYSETMLGNIADCMRAAIACKSAMMGEEMKIEDAPLDDDLADQLIDDGDPCEIVGTIMGVNAYEKDTKTTNRTITLCSWFVPEDINSYVEEDED